MNRYVLISADEYVALQAYRQRVELERVQRVLKYWSEHIRPTTNKEKDNGNKTNRAS